MMVRRGKEARNKNFFLILSLLFCLFLVLSISFVYASYSSGSKKSFIQNSYSSGQRIEGWINISLSDENAKSEISDNLGNKISLIDLLKKTSVNYSCIPNNCEDDYSAQDSGISVKNININGEKFMGIILTGKNVEVTKFEFSGNSNAGDSCSQQLTIDLADDSTNDWGNKKYTSENCGSELKSTCYTGIFLESVSLSKVPYCEKINLKKAPAFEIKAFVKKSQTSSEFYSGLLKGWIYSKDGDLMGECNFNNPLSSFSQIKCIVEYTSVEDEDHYVCISYEEAASNPQGYDLQARLSGNYCGFLGDPKQTGEFNGDYNIVASGKKFASLTNFQVNETGFINSDETSFVSYINNYITTKYNKDCSAGVGCVVPIKLNGLNQGLTVNNLKLDYSSQGSAGTSSNLFYEIQKNSAKINSPYIKVDLSHGNLFTPSISGNYTWRLFINGQVFEEANISVSGKKGKIILQVYPRDVPVATSNNFIAFLDSDINTTGIKLVWNFGDGTGEQITEGNRAKHTYSSLGNYTLNIKVLRGTEELSSENFQISTKSPKDVINVTILQYKSDIENTEKQMNSLSDNYRKIIRDNYLNDIQQTKGSLGNLENEYKRLLSDSTTTDQEYVTLMNSLNSLKIPNSIQDSERSNFNFIYSPDDVDLEKITKLFNEYYELGEEDEYIRAINEWYFNNLNVTLNHRIISIYYQDSVDNAISEFKFNIKPEDSINHNVYFIVEADADEIVFNADYDPIIEAGYTGIKLDTIETFQEISFGLDGGVDSFELPVYIVPKLSILNIDSDSGSGGEEKSIFAVVLPWLAVLIIVAVAVYILLQQWYKRKYENYLFKNKSELYNLLYFIDNAKKRGLTDKQIIEELKKNKWKSEKIDYAMNKFYGKRTGMWEIPIFTWFEKRKIKKEMVKRQAPRAAY